MSDDIVNGILRLFQRPDQVFAEARMKAHQYEQERMMQDSDYQELSKLAASAVELMREERDEARRERDEARWLFAYAVSKLGELEVHRGDYLDMRKIDLRMARDECRDTHIYRTLPEESQ